MLARAYTLVELLIVMAILGIATVLAVVGILIVYWVCGG